MVFEVKQIGRNVARRFIEKWHYSHDINGVLSTYCFGLFDGDNLIGACIYGDPAMAGLKKKYGNCIELRRLACIDDTPKNTESYFIGKTLRWLKNHTRIDYILSYADLTYGHAGTIYQATNFKLIGQTAIAPKIEWKGKLYHDKALRTTYNGKPKPFAKRLADALESGEAKWVDTKPKNIYLLEIKRPKNFTKLGQMELQVEREGVIGFDKLSTL